METVAGEEEELFKPIESVTDQTWGDSVMEIYTPEPLWTVFNDGSSNVGGAGVARVIFTPGGSRIEKATRLGFQASKKEDAIIGLKAVKQLDAKNVKLVTDSILVVNQFLGTYRAKEERMALYMDRMRELENEFDQFSIGQRPRMENRHADALTNLSSAVETDTTRFVWGERAATSAHGDTENIDNNMDVDSPVIDDSGNHVKNVADWRHPYIQYLTTGELPEDEHLASKVKKNAWRYSMIEGQLYRKPVALEPFLRCISAEEGQQILAEAHEGICGSYSGGRSHAHRILTQGYFWPYMQKDFKEYAQKCVPCQEHAPISKRPAKELHPVFSPWPFSMWGLASSDHFSKLLEALNSFGIPDAIISYNGKQFDSEVIKDFCKNLNIRHNFSSPYYAHSNGQAEATNRVIMDNLKKRLEKAKGKWKEEFPGVATPKRSTGFSPFTLAYGTEAVIPTEVHLKTTKTRAVKSGKNDSILALDKELLEEKRETTLQQLVRYQQAINLSYDHKACTLNLGQPFEPFGLANSITQEEDSRIMQGQSMPVTAGGMQEPVTTGGMQGPVIAGGMQGPITAGGMQG
ncbi:uncharacterized protein LOC113273034 [Papaver somniferum]|uniref:uncharacterized protein LOC113273034 n=1 Tax=Papaver somniferum TaxID=3469 RepID=UPI000E703750|nr:uncharacterized protein LOC113273034 [Papaver somniferum]